MTPRRRKWQAAALVGTFAALGELGMQLASGSLNLAGGGKAVLFGVVIGTVAKIGGQWIAAWMTADEPNTTTSENG